MKRIIVLLLIIYATACFAETDCDNYDFPPETTLIQVTQQTNIPFKKLLEFLDLDFSTPSKSTLQEVNISSEEIVTALKKYTNCKNSFFGGIVWVGMSIVFISLILVGLCIACLQYMNRKKKPKTIQTSKGKVTAPAEHTNSNAIIAAITAIYLHEAEVEEKNRLLLTWKRSRLSMWSAANMVENKAFDNKRGR